jgi:hypothetical protein
MRRRDVSLHYCNSCGSTTRHAESEHTSTCLRCGTVKQITRVVKAVNQPDRERNMEFN